MLESLNVTQIISVNADQTWTAISRIGGLERWFPVITGCTVIGSGEGASRIMTLADGATIKDHIDTIDHRHKRFRYTRTESPFPVQSYRGTVEISVADANTAQVSRSLEIDVAQDQREPLVEFLRNTLADGIQGLEQDLQRPTVTV